MEQYNSFTEEDQIEALKTSGTGVWKLEAEEGQHTRFYGDSLMNQLIGVSDDTSPEERMDFFMAHIYKEDFKLFMEYYNALKETNQAEVVYRYDHPAMGVIYVRCGGKKSFSEGNYCCYRGFHMNVTDTLRVEQETKARLTRKAELFRTISFKMMEHSADSLAKINLQDGHFEWISMDGTESGEYPEYRSVFRDRAAYVPEEYREEYLANSDLDCVVENLKKQDYYSFSVFIHRPEDGELRRITFWYYKLENDENSILSIFRDTTEDYQKEKQLEEALLMSERANSAKTLFLNNISHDIRTPMNAIIGFTDLAQKYLEDKDRCEDYLKKIKSSSNHLLSLINDVLDMSRIESGRMELHTEPVSIKGLMEELNTLLHTDAEAKGLDFSVKCEYIEHDVVFCDKLRLNQVLLNCLSNSIKFTNSGGKISASVRELVCMHTENHCLYEFVVEDTGIGMSEKYQKKIFEPFSREENKVHKIQGTGLGMSICKNIVDMMEGSIEVESKLGEGTRFTIRICFEQADETMQIGIDCENIDVERFRGKRILLAEDNDLNTEIATLLLEEVGFLVERAEDGAVCVQMIKDAKVGYYDVVLMDVQMPNLNGYEATKEIRRLENVQKAGIPIIAMTANAFEEDKQRAISCGMNGHVAKPIDVKNLMKQLAVIF